MRHSPCVPPAGARRLGRRCALAGAALLAAATGCQRDAVSYYRVPKEAPTAPAAMPGMGGGGMGPAGSAGPMAGDVPPPAAPAAEAALRWKLPKGWTESVAGGMRYATFKPAVRVPGKVDASVVVLPGPAGGELANVNRWRNQIDLPPMDEGAMARARQTVRAPVGSIALYDFTSEAGPRRRVVAGFLVHEGSSWFLKLSGDAEPVAAARADFVRLLESVHR